MTYTEKRFGPLVIGHRDDCADVEFVGESPFVTDVDADEMIDALREAADWLEWRRACEKRGEG